MSSKKRDTKPKPRRKPPNKHKLTSKDELFDKCLQKAPELKKWMQKEGIWIKELFQILVKDYKITKTDHIKSKITSNLIFDEIIRQTKLKRNESNKEAQDMKRLDNNLLKFEKLWRNMTGIKRKVKKVTINAPQKDKKLPPKPIKNRPQSTKHSQSGSSRPGHKKSKSDRAMIKKKKKAPKINVDNKQQNGKKTKSKLEPSSPVPNRNLPSRPHSARPGHTKKNHSAGTMIFEPQQKRPRSARSKKTVIGLPKIDSETEEKHFEFPNPMKNDNKNKRKKSPKHKKNLTTQSITMLDGKGMELEKEGFELCFEAENFEEKRSFRKAIKFYSLGIMKLFKTLNFIKKDGDKKQRIKQIDGYKLKKKRCQFDLNKDKIMRRENEKKGMEHCLLAEEYEKKQGYELAVKYYEKGIPLLMKSIENLDHKLSKQYKCDKITRYKNNLMRCKQNHYNKNTSKHNNKDKNKEKLIGNLFDYIGEGNIDTTIVSKCELSDLYLVLPVLISSLSHIPISFKVIFRDKLVNKLNEIIENSAMLEQRLRCYLFSYSFDKNIYFNASLKSIYRYHPCMPQLAYNIFGDDLKKDEEDELKINEQEKAKNDTFESYYFERDCISFFRTLSHNLSLSSKLSNKLFGKQIIKHIDKDIVIYDLLGNNVEISSVEIKKVFKSNAKPILVRGIVNNEKSGYYNMYNDKINFNYIVKLGDDLRRDSAIISMFKLMNYFWNKHSLKYNKNYDIQCLIYSVIPMGNDFGVIEYIEDCVPLSDLNKLIKDDKCKSIIDFKNKSLDNNFLCKLVSTSAAAYIASFVCGIRDRHYDNILIRKTDGSLFHIDFNYLWTKVGFIDASKIAITKDFKLFIGDKHWEGFVNIAAKAYLIIRKHFNQIISFSEIVFDFVKSEKTNSSIEPQTYLYNQLRIYLDDDKAEEYIRKKLEAAPYNVKTKLKNAIHKIAT